MANVTQPWHPPGIRSVARGKYVAPIFLLAPLLAFLLVFYVTPFAFMVQESFRHSALDGDPDAGMTLYQYLKTWTSSRIGRVMERTFRMSILTVAITLVISYPIALLLLRLGPTLKTVILLVIFISLASSLIVRNYGWVVVLADRGALNVFLQSIGIIDEPIRLLFSETAIIVALVHFSIPFMVLPIYGSLLRQPASWSEASLSLGASHWRTFCSITLPLSLPGVFGGTILTFALSMSAYVTPLMLGSPSSSMISQVAAEQLLIQLNFPYGAAIIVTLTIITFAIVAAYATVLRKVFKADV
ncbi:MAG: ABC transporter permease [Burkholderiaceae bacterium]|nr:ABC transporter permease [Burkholderiaceae bacterium]